MFVENFFLLFKYALCVDFGKVESNFSKIIFFQKNSTFPLTNSLKGIIFVENLTKKSN